MTTQFKTLLTMTLAHAYYREGCRDIQYIIPHDTVQILKNGRLLAKELDGKLHVLFEADEAGMALIPVPGKMVRLGLQLVNPFFTNFTAVGADFASAELLYRNSTTATSLDVPVHLALVSPMFSHTITDSARPVTVQLKDAAGQVFQTDTISPAENRTTISYNLAGHAPGAWSVEEAYPASAKQIAYYCDAELVSAGVFGVLEMRIADNFYVTAANFQLAFAAREETLKYYVVASNFSNGDFDQLAVSDAGFAEEGRPQIGFTKVSSGSFAPADIAPALLGDPSVKVVLFKSQTAVARSEKGRRKIQLKKNNEVLITHLPQPGPEKSSAELIVSVSKP